MMAQFPEMKIGEGGGCMTYLACEKTKRKTMMKTMLASEVSQALSINHNPICISRPVTAKIKARRKRGSARKRPFQFASIAHSESGR